MTALEKFLAALTREQFSTVNKEQQARVFDVTVEVLLETFERMHKASNEYEEEAIKPPEPYPVFPVMTGSLHELACAIGPSLAMEHKYLHLLTTFGLRFSGNIQFANETWFQPRFYSCMVGPPSSTKTAVDKECRKALIPKTAEEFDGPQDDTADYFKDVRVNYSINSGPALVQAFEAHRKILLAADEISSLFDKARSTTASPNSLLGEFLRLYDSNEIGRSVVRSGKKDKITGARTNAGDCLNISNAHLSIIAGATDRSFEKIWQGTGGSASGLQSRFVLSHSDLKLPPFQVPTDAKLVKEILREQVRVLSSFGSFLNLAVSEEAKELVLAWVAAKSGDLPPRSLDMAKRACIILAACAGERSVSSTVMTWALAFADYEIALKRRLMPLDSENSVQAFENRILGYYDRNESASAREVKRALHPQRHAGGYWAFEKAMFTLIHVGELVSTGGNRVGKPVYRRDTPQN